MQSAFALHEQQYAATAIAAAVVGGDKVGAGSSSMGRLTSVEVAEALLAAEDLMEATLVPPHIAAEKEELERVARKAAKKAKKKEKKRQEQLLETGETEVEEKNKKSKKEKKQKKNKKKNKKKQSKHSMQESSDEVDDVEGVIELPTASQGDYESEELEEVYSPEMVKRRRRAKKGVSKFIDDEASESEDENSRNNRRQLKKAEFGDEEEEEEEDEDGEEMKDFIVGSQDSLGYLDKERVRAEQIKKKKKKIAISSDSEEELQQAPLKPTSPPKPPKRTISSYFMSKPAHFATNKNNSSSSSNVPVKAATPLPPVREHVIVLSSQDDNMENEPVMVEDLKPLPPTPPRSATPTKCKPLARRQVDRSPASAATPPVSAGKPLAQRSLNITMQSPSLSPVLTNSTGSNGSNGHKKQRFDTTPIESAELKKLHSRFTSEFDED